MRAVVLGAGRGIHLLGNSTPKCMVEGLSGWRVLDWLLNALRTGGDVDDVLFVAGDDLEDIRAAYPQISYRHNPQWREHHVVGSLAVLDDDDVRNGFFFSYSDIVYRPESVARLAACDADIAIVVDRSWRHRYRNRGEAALADAEKVVTVDDRVIRIGKGVDLDDQVGGEFIGLARFSARGAATLRSLDASLRPLYAQRAYRGARNLDNACLSDLLQEVIDQGGQVQAVAIDGNWAELDDPRDLTQFVFGTKAETLERLSPILHTGRIDPGVRLQVGEWLHDPDLQAQRLASRFPHGPVAVRSSAHSEDTGTSSAAGRYTSVMGVEGGNATALQEAVSQVVASYDEAEALAEDHVLIQPFLNDVVMSGVLMTRDLDTGADYMVVHYDDVTGRTDSVTAGTGTSTSTLRLCRDAVQLPADPRFRSLLRTAAELESITGSDALDIEFAFTPDQELHVLQVRPIAAQHGWSPRDREAVAAEIRGVREFVSRRLAPHDQLPGTLTALGQMPDWNPAEMIGPFPAPLAASLYRSLITDRAWRQARVELGYADVPHRALMVELAGRPYVDVRLSALNLLPAALAPACRGRIVDAGVRRLRRHPHLHDKIEFGIWATCLDLDAARTFAALREAGLPASDVAPYRDALLQLTNQLVTQGVARLAHQSQRAGALAGSSQALLAATPLTATPDVVSTLLQRTVVEGTVPFSIAARLAFVATSILRSLQAVGAWDATTLQAFLASVESVSSHFVRDLDRVRRGEASELEFLATYGHLRPGTYDILSPRYDAAPQLYLSGHARPVANVPGFDLTAEQQAEGDRRLRDAGLAFDLATLLSFARAAIAGRESIKMAFTWNVSAILERLAAWGDHLGLDREEVSLLEMGDVIALADRSPAVHTVPTLVRRIADRRVARQRQAQVALPVLITDPVDVDCVRQVAAEPNFVGCGRRTAEVVHLDRPDAGELAGRIVVVQSADPGFDWIFGHGIAGLVTRFGGANSHMTIRCAEFGLPAAIGCGEALYSAVASAHRVELDCDGRQIHVLA